LKNINPASGGQSYCTNERQTKFYINSINNSQFLIKLFVGPFFADFVSEIVDEKLLV
jgi:hypothetical protein